MSPRGTCLSPASARTPLSPRRGWHRGSRGRRQQRRPWGEAGPARGQRSPGRCRRAGPGGSRGVPGEPPRLSNISGNKIAVPEALGVTGDTGGGDSATPAAGECGDPRPDWWSPPPALVTPGWSCHTPGVPCHPPSCVPVPPVPSLSPPRCPCPGVPVTPVPPAVPVPHQCPCPPPVSLSCPCPPVPSPPPIPFPTVPALPGGILGSGGQFWGILRKVPPPCPGHRDRGPALGGGGVPTLTPPTPKILPKNCHRASPPPEPPGPPRDPPGGGRSPHPPPKFLLLSLPPPAPGAELRSEPPDLGRKKWKWEFLCHRRLRCRRPPLPPAFWGKKAPFSPFFSLFIPFPPSRGFAPRGGGGPGRFWNCGNSGIAAAGRDRGFGIATPAPIPTSAAGPSPSLPSSAAFSPKIPFKSCFWGNFPPPQLHLDAPSGIYPLTPSQIPPCTPSGIPQKTHTAPGGISSQFSQIFFQFFLFFSNFFQFFSQLLPTSSNVFLFFPSSAPSPCVSRAWPGVFPARVDPGGGWKIGIAVPGWEKTGGSRFSTNFLWRFFFSSPLGASPGSGIPWAGRLWNVPVPPQISVTFGVPKSPREFCPWDFWGDFWGFWAHPMGF
ncbi:formin-2-like isoform X2 [Passer domesticus]|uniref:formin-2-like isoform X2 n=1 Tax=Passer domesticus TaxID=48849 RepID=UPI0030FEF64E